MGITLNDKKVQSFSALADKLDGYAKKINSKNKQFLETVAKRLSEIISEEYSQTPIGAELVFSTKLNGNTITVSTKHEELLYYEFGAGIHYQSNNAPKPDGVSDIGMFGNKIPNTPSRGRQDKWVYKDKSGEKVWTHGILAVRGLYHAVARIKGEINEIAKATFKNKEK